MSSRSCRNERSSCQRRRRARRPPDDAPGVGLLVVQPDLQVPPGHRRPTGPQRPHHRPRPQERPSAHHAGGDHRARRPAVGVGPVGRRPVGAQPARGRPRDRHRPPPHGRRARDRAGPGRAGRVLPRRPRPARATRTARCLVHPHRRRGRPRPPVGGGRGAARLRAPPTPMTLTDFSIRNPLVVGGLAVALCLFGLVAYLRMGVAVTPNVNAPIVLVTTVYPGADAETIEANVTRPIEDAIATLPNIDANGLVSTSAAGLSTVSVQFTEAADADLVAVDVQRVVNGARNRLPADAEPPTVTKLDFTSAQGVVTVVLAGKQPLARLQQLAEDVVQPQFNALPGVGSASIRSGIVREVHVLVDEEKLRSRGLSINQVVGALQSQQLEVPAGTISQGTRDISVYFDSLAPGTQALGAIVVNQTPAGPVYLRDVARVEDAVRERSAIVRVDGQEGVALVVGKLQAANTIAVADEVKAAIARLNPQLPPGTRLDVVVDTSVYTAKSFIAVRNALLEAVVITGLILLLFLHTWRSTVIVMISIPVSILVTLVLMNALDYNLNLLTTVALTVSVGILVDDSIVVLENIYRHLDRGQPPLQAALDGRSEIGLAAITITFVDVVVYLPLAVLTTGLPRQFIGPDRKSVV